jgi:hypothetical protein
MVVMLLCYLLSMNRDLFDPNGTVEEFARECGTYSTRAGRAWMVHIQRSIKWSARVLHQAPSPTRASRYLQQALPQLVPSHTPQVILTLPTVEATTDATRRNMEGFRPWDLACEEQKQSDENQVTPQRTASKSFSISLRSVARVWYAEPDPEYLNAKVEQYIKHPVGIDTVAQQLRLPAFEVRPGLVRFIDARNGPDERTVQETLARVGWRLVLTTWCLDGAGAVHDVLQGVKKRLSEDFSGRVIFHMPPAAWKYGEETPSMEVEMQKVEILPSDLDSSL